MSQLHGCGLVYKDLKGSNILVLPSWTTNEEGDESLNTFIPAKREFYFTKVGDYDSLDDVAGTGFWRAPEVLQALRNGSDVKLAQSPAVDVYSLGMVCYEILIVLNPFQGHPLSNYELVLSGRQPELADDVSPKMREFVHQCWHMDPRQRPDWDEIKTIVACERPIWDELKKIVACEWPNWDELKKIVACEQQKIRDSNNETPNAFIHLAFKLIPLPFTYLHFFFIFLFFNLYL
jgi:serine/threonine protein kinase